MNVVEKKINELIPYDKNPRNNKEAVKYVKESIEQFGFKVPIIIDKDNVIVAGHTRLLAGKELGMETVPCIIADDLTDEQVKAFRLADNKVSEFAQWDLDLLGEELDDIMNIDMSDFGFMDLDLEDDEDDEIERTDLSDKVFEKYEVIITCKDENDLEETYNKLMEEGYECRISTL